MRCIRRWSRLLVMAIVVIVLILTKRHWVILQNETATNQLYVGSEVQTNNINSGAVINEDISYLQEQMNVDKRGKFQRERMEEFCKKFTHLRKDRFPPKENERLRFMRHMMFDDKHKVIFCFAPKVGSTNLKRLLLYMGNKLPMETLNWAWVDNAEYLEPALKHASFLNYTLTDSDRYHRLKNYYKFTMVRNPLERIVSAYRNKLEAPLERNIAQQHNRFPDKIKVKILQRYRSDELHYWNNTHSSRRFNISVTFSEYIRYLTDTNWTEIQEHFQPQLEACHPCFINYDFYGDFRNISRDVAELIRKFKTNPMFYQEGNLHTQSEQTSGYMHQYYDKLTHREKMQLIGAWYDELAFYYTLYPSEQHKQYDYLGVKEPIY